MLIKNNRGWVKIVEAFIAILLIAFVALIIINKESVKQDDSTKIYKTEWTILKEIRLNDTTRNDILSISVPEINGSTPGFPASVLNRIEQRRPNYLNCTTTVCNINIPCNLQTPTKNVFVQTAFIGANETIYNPKQIKLFCWPNSN